MSDPIADLCRLGGETVVLSSPVTVGAFNPGAGADYAPPSASTQTYRGVPAARAAVDEVVDVAASAAVTISCATLPTRLDNKETRVIWRGATWTLLRHRQRYWQGALNGVTLYLAA